MKARVGRLVIVPVANLNGDGVDEAAAVISRVWADDNVNVRVFGDSNDVEWRTALTLTNTKPDDPLAGNVCWWPAPDDATTDVPTDVPEDTEADSATPIAKGGK